MDDSETASITAGVRFPPNLSYYYAFELLFFEPEDRIPVNCFKRGCLTCWFFEGCANFNYFSGLITSELMSLLDLIELLWAKKTGLALSSNSFT